MWRTCLLYTSDELSVTLADIMQNVIDDTPIPDGCGILHNGEGVDLLPANIALSGMELRLINAMSRENVLRTYINAVKPHYDYILIEMCIRDRSHTGIGTMGYFRPQISYSVPTRKN